MNGVTDFYLQNKIDDLYELLKEAITNIKSLSTKIDGKPALVIWSKFPGLAGPGVGFKSLIKQTQENRAKDYFTDEEEIDIFMKSKDLSDDEKLHRTLAFKEALKLSKYVKPGCMIWGDVLFVPGEKKQIDTNLYECAPNTITYHIDGNLFKNVNNAEFGIVFHTVIYNDFSQTKIRNLNDFLFTDKEFCICPEDLNINVNNLNTDKLNQVYDKAKKLQPSFTDDLLKQLRKEFKKIGQTKEEILSHIKFENKELLEKIIDNIFEFNYIKENILNNTKVVGITPYINGNISNGEGIVVNIEGKEPLKLVSDTEFTKYNIEHMKSLKERIIDNGQNVLAWTSSKSSNLFNFYLSKELQYGLTGGSNYGFATYLVTEPPFTEGAEVGYSDEYRRKLYGDNIFEFEIPVDRIVFFDFNEYKKTVKGKVSEYTFDNFVINQIKDLGVEMTDEEYASLQPTNPNKTNSAQGLNLFKILSRYFYQGHRGNLRTPIDGFQYKGRNDGNTLVVWNSNRLIPRQYSNDLGQTWKEIDTSSPEFIEYVKSAQKMIYSYNEDKYQNSIFDGNKTFEKKQVYRLLMAFNSNDGLDSKGKPINKLSDGIFYNIVIHNDKTIDASFKYNLPYNDYGKHFYRLRQNQFLEKIFDLGYRFNKLECGVKIGSETDKTETWESVKEEWWPKEVTEGLKLVCLPITKEHFNFNCKFDTKQLYLTKCEIIDDVFDDWEVILDENEEKFSTCSYELKEQLIQKYEWAKNLHTNVNLKESMIKRFKEGKNYTNVLDEIYALMNINNLVFINKNHTLEETTDLKQATEGNKIHVRQKRVEEHVTPRETVMENFIKSLPDGSYISSGSEHTIVFKWEDTEITFRFHLSEGEKKGGSATLNTFEQEHVFARFLNEDYHEGFKKTYDEIKQYIKDNLLDIAPNVDAWYNKDWYNTYVKGSPILRQCLGEENKDQLITNSWEKSEFCSKLISFLKEKFNIGSYKKWTVADTWIYPKSKKQEAFEIFNKSYDSIIDFNNTLIDMYENQILVGLSLKCKSLITENSKIELKSQNIIFDNDYDKFISLNISSGGKKESLCIKTNWINGIHSQYYFRNPDAEKTLLCRFSILDPGSQRSYCSYDEFSNFVNNEIVKNTCDCLGKELSETQVKIYCQSILDSNITTDKYTIQFLTKYINSPELFKSDMILTHGQVKYTSVMCQLIMMMYAISKMNEEERDIFITKVYKKCNSIGPKFAPYLFIGVFN